VGLRLVLLIIGRQDARTDDGRTTRRHIVVWEDGFVPSLSAADRAAIEQAADAYLAAMNAADWKRVARSFSEGAVRIPPNEEPHQGREAIERWLGGIEELSSYELTRDTLDGADGIAYVRGRYAITLRPVGAPAPLSDEGDFLEIWRKEPDGAWCITEAMWNTRLPASA
jgi:ketosteroid isomerase-like protein